MCNFHLYIKYFNDYENFQSPHIINQFSYNSKKKKKFFYCIKKHTHTCIEFMKEICQVGIDKNKMTNKEILFSGEAAFWNTFQTVSKLYMLMLEYLNAAKTTFS